MALTPAQLQAQVKADQQALAQSDLAALQAFQAIATNTTTTVAAIEAAFAALPAQLGDPDRQALVTQMQGQYNAFLAQLATMISQANAIANPAV